MSNKVKTYNVTLTLTDRVLHGIQLSSKKDVQSFIKLCYLMPNYLKVEVSEDE